MPLPSFIFVVEVGDIDHALEVVRLSELGDNLVHLLADLFIALGRHHISEAAALRHIEKSVLLLAVFVRNVFHEQQDEHVVLVLRSVHAAAQFIAARPQRRIKFRFFDSHASGSLLEMAGVEQTESASARRCERKDNH